METKEALKLLAKAIKQHQPEQSPPVDLSTLPPLPDLQIPLQPKLNLQPQINPEPSNDLSFDSHGIKAQIAIRDALVKALYSKDGNTSVSANTPLFGGNLDIGYDKNQGNKSYNLKYQKNF